MPFLPYHEPGIATLLSLTSFIVVLNAARYVLDHMLFCGLLGEIFVGIIWGLPLGGTSWLSQSVQETVQSLGYLGLIGIVFEGGLGTSISQLKKTALMSVSIATAGLCLPIALSFILLRFPYVTQDGDTVYPTPLAAFSAGASLCSTSLGTTFAILSAAGMQKTRLGVVLVGAAMMDDVVGLVMVKIITALGSGEISGWAIARPIIASFALMLVTLAITPWVLLPLLRAVVHWLHRREGSSEAGAKKKLNERCKSIVRDMPHTGFILVTLILLVFVTIAAFVDASILFASFLAGGLVTTLWAASEPQGDEVARQDGAAGVYERYYGPAVTYVLAPFFFASIGFAIPVRDMFNGSIVWKGVLYTLLMFLAKAAVGSVVYAEYLIKRIGRPLPGVDSAQESISRRAPHFQALTISLAMVARGEIGFLIASLSLSSGTLTLQAVSSMAAQDSPESEGLFLTITWAVVLCTLIGPVGVGIMVSRLHRLESRSSPPSLDGSIGLTSLSPWM